MKYEKYVPKNKWEENVLNYNPFEGDFGEPGDITFKDRLITSRKEHRCIYCCNKINKGDTYRKIVSKFSGELMTHRYCKQCCDAMAISWRDEGRAIEKRVGWYSD